MSVEMIGIDHVFVAVSDLRRSERFYDRVMPVLGFRKGDGTIGDAHLFYYNRQFAYSLRLRVVDEAAVDRAARELREAGVEATEPRYYPEYAPDYYATFVEDPDKARGDELPGDPSQGHVRLGDEGRPVKTRG